MPWEPRATWTWEAVSVGEREALAWKAGAELKPAVWLDGVPGAATGAQAVIALVSGARSAGHGPGLRCGAGEVPAVPASVAEAGPLI